MFAASPTENVPRTLVALDDAGDPARYGHKAVSLAQLRQQGFDVPDGFVIPVGASPSADEIGAALRRLGDGAVAVRSSGVAEDLPDASFAGQYDTILDVRGAADVLAAASRCRASASSARVASYGQAAQPMAVLVQAMVDADAAGVAFSANPVTGDRDEVRVSATRGLGDKLVGGEVDGDEWSVKGGDAQPLAQPQAAIDRETALRIATLARRIEKCRGTPQDIEWAVRGERLALLQARPITVLPVAPEIETPVGTWQKDAAHFPEPVCPFAASTHLRDDGFFEIFPVIEWGLMLDSVRVRVIGHEFYIHVEPDDGGAKPPPWWVIGLVAQVVPSLRRKLKRARQVVESGLLDTLPARWNGELKAELKRQIQAHARLDLSALDDAGLFDHLEELRIFAGENMQLHFRLFMPHAVGLHELAEVCKDLLGWDLTQMTQLLQGLSEASAAPTRELASIAALARARPSARMVIEGGGPDLLERLEVADPEVAARLDEYLSTWGLRTYGPDAGGPNVAERPELVADLLVELIADDSMPDLSTARSRVVAEARAALSDPVARKRFDEALAYAEIVYPLREDNVILTEQIPVGLLRRGALEAGHRLVTRGRLASAQDALMLSAEELRQAMGSDEDLRRTVALRRSEIAWVRANPGPMTYGPAPGPAPDLRGLPEPARRLNRALLWMLDQEVAAPPPTVGDEVAGIGASPGVYRGRVRVIRSVSELHRLRSGEVLVCPTTSAAWMMVFRKAGALVTDAGSALSHTATVAREHALPAVVATSRAHAPLKDGDEVTVDGTRGTVVLTKSKPAAH